MMMIIAQDRYRDGLWGVMGEEQGKEMIVRG
jgi:hypothetical protein